jgi:restriction system protein
LKALQSLGGSALISEIPEQIAKDLGLPDSMLDILHGDGPRSELAYRSAWARTYLRQIGAVENSSRGVWTITQSGKEITSNEQARDLVNQFRQNRPKSENKTTQAGQSRLLNPDSDDTDDWKQTLLQIIRAIEPGAFERLCQRVLREAGFQMVEVTGRSGDGGIDGTGLLRLNLLSFHVRFQCKRYSGTVGSREIRDFRGGLVGRADKGLFITTGRFSAEASREAVRDGATAIDLVDGDHLCDLLKQYGLGTSVETVERVHIEEEFFGSF